MTMREDRNVIDQFLNWLADMDIYPSKVLKSGYVSCLCTDEIDTLVTTYFEGDSR